MSMRDYAVDDYGLILGEWDMSLLAAKFCDGYTDDEFDKDPMGFLEMAADELGFDYISEFTGEAIPLSDTGEYEWNESREYNDDMVYYLRTTHYPSLFKQAYKNIDEVVEEFRQALGDYLPEEFDYKAHLYHIVGTYFG